jgi:hypothetical protein
MMTYDIIIQIIFCFSPYKIHMSRGIDYFTKLSNYGSDLYHGKISPLRFANDAVIKPLVFELAR